MTATPPKEDIMGDSWIELCASPTGSQRSTPPLIGPQFKSPDRSVPFSATEEYLRLLREAQRESNQSSQVSLASSSRRDTPHSSPKSPPNSPNTEHCPDEDLKNVYINYWSKDGDAHKDTDWIWEWSSRPDQQPPKDWKFEHPHTNPKRKPRNYSIRLARVGKNSLFSKEVLYSLLLTNVLSLLLGAGLGLWLSKRGILLARVTID